jgi:N-acetylglucosaminyldiphosphoundecaprenol N-acetyl-beta-D-mannosaminyltransferase
VLKPRGARGRVIDLTRHNRVPGVPVFLSKQVWGSHTRGLSVNLQMRVSSPHSEATVRLPGNGPRANVLGIGIHALDLPSAVERVESTVLGGGKEYVCVTGVHGVMEARRDPEFRRILDRALLVTPDGVPTVWVGRLQGHAQMGRVFGPDLMLDVCHRSVKKGFTHFLYGGKPGVANDLRINLNRWFPGIRIVGTFTPPFRPLDALEQTDLENVIRRLRPDIVWVGLNTPKQERFMAENIDRLACRLMIGVGAAFDFHTGRLKDSPGWVKHAGLQWMHRLCQEPSRLWKRYLINNSSFLLQIILQLTGLKVYKLNSEALATTRDT